MVVKPRLRVPSELDRLPIQGQHVLAAIDVGTNSIHTLIVNIDPQMPSFTTIASEKETVRLGETNPETGSLTPVAMQRACEALERSLSLAKSYRAEAVVAAATSAVREAPNGTEFLERIEQELGLAVDLISGQEEARRIYLGVLSAVAFNEQPHVIIDIGGGSTEFIVGDGRDPLFLRSLKVGAVRLTQQFAASNPPSPSDFHRLRGYVQAMLEPVTEAIGTVLQESAPGQPVRAIGTSGTIEALALVDAQLRLGEVPSPLHGYALSQEGLKAIVKEMRYQTVAERSKIPGMNERRAEIIVAGAVILQEALQLLGATEVTICERALREGLIVDWMLTHNLIEDRLRFQSQVRERHVLRLANKYRVDMGYAERVSDLTLSLFDQTQRLLHHWGDRERELLWAAAMLHNCGHFVSHASHHKHSYYLIRYGELLGFTEEEIEAIANLARYHRKSSPKKKHEGYLKLPDESYRRMVSELSALLRIATALHRRPTPAIRSVAVELDSQTNVIHLFLTPCRRDDDCSVELWTLDYKKAPFEVQFGFRLQAHLR